MNTGGRGHPPIGLLVCVVVGAGLTFFSVGGSSTGIFGLGFLTLFFTLVSPLAIWSINFELNCIVNDSPISEFKRENYHSNLG